MKAIFSILSLFLILSGNCQAVEIIPIQETDKNAFQMTISFIAENPDYQMLVISDNHLFRGHNNKIVACQFTETGNMQIYDVYCDHEYIMHDSYNRFFFHVFEHGEERQTWEYLNDNVLFARN